jgi:DNA-binding FadR family transcriptional regulator
MATVTSNGHRTATLTQVRRWIDRIDKPYVTTGDAMEKFGISRATARDRLSTLAEEGLLTRTGNGRGAKYHTGRTGDGDGGGKPVFAADVTELDFIRKLASDCDQELERIDGEIAALEAAREELLAQEAQLRTERESVARAKTVLG